MDNQSEGTLLILGDSMVKDRFGIDTRRQIQGKSGMSIVVLPVGILRAKAAKEKGVSEVWDMYRAMSAWEV